jgi:RNA polymerase sigma factor (sigma-70 family)
MALTPAFNLGPHRILLPLGARGGGNVHRAHDTNPNRDAALKALAATDLRESQVVDLRYFGDLSVEETAEVLKVSTDTVLRDWNLARSWLRRELSGEKPDGA